MRLIKRRKKMPVILIAILYTAVNKNYYAWNLKQIFTSSLFKANTILGFMPALVEIVTLN